MKEKNMTFKYKSYIFIIIILIEIIFVYYNYKKGLVTLLLITLIGYIYEYNQSVKKNLKKSLQEMQSSNSCIIDDIPTPLLIVDNNGLIVWHNSRFLKVVNKKRIIDKSVYEILPQLNLNDIKLGNEDAHIELEHDGNSYDILYSIDNISQSKDSSMEYMIILYFIDTTEYINYRKEYNEVKVNVGLVYIDNYEDLMSDIDASDKSAVLAEIDKRLNTFIHQINGLIKRTDRDKYLIIFENKYLKKLEEEKFYILDKIRDIKLGNNIPVTLSIGIGIGGETLGQTYEYSRAAMDIALGRGGDQVVIKDVDNLNFYGGKSTTLEKRTKVKARIISYALKQLIDQSENIFIMGHAISDMDSFGASIGVYRAVKNADKNCFIVLNNVSESIKNIYEKLQNEQPEYLDDIVSYEQIKEVSFNQSLCIVVDTHVPEQTEAPDILNRVDKVVIIDHHRRGKSFIESPILTYLEPYASSTSELVTEILYYMENDISMTKFDAKALLAGIAVDTKNFAINTGVRTFEAALFLKRKGANAREVRELFQDDMDTFILKGEIIKNINIFKEGIAISKLERDSSKSILVAAQVADEILNIKDIVASFVLAKIGNQVHISGRSTEKISVQLILEKVGGGGHMTVAGAKIENATVDEAEDMLKKAILEYFEEGEE